MVRFNHNSLIIGVIACICSSFLNGCANPDEQLRIRNAIDQGNIEQLQKSLNSGDDPCYALNYAVKQKQINSVRFLLGHGVNPDQSGQGNLIDDLTLIDTKTNTPIVKNESDIAKLTYYYFADGLTRMDAKTNTPIVINKSHLFVAGNFYFRYKLKRMADRTPLFDAIDNNDVEMVRLLLEHGADARKPFLAYPMLFFDPATDTGSISSKGIWFSILLGEDFRSNTIFYLRRGDYILSNLMPVQGKVMTAMEYANFKGKTALVQILESSAKQK